MEKDSKRFAFLLRNVQKGNKASLEILCREIEHILHGYFKNKFSEKDIVDDLSQDTYLKLLENLPNIKEPQKLKSFVLKLAFHVTQTYLRQKYRNKIELISEQEDDYNDFETIISEKSMNGSDTGEFISRMDLNELLKRMPEKTRQILYMKADGYKYEEIADKVGLSVSGVKMQIKRNLEKLKIILSCVTFWVVWATILIETITG